MIPYKNSNRTLNTQERNESDRRVQKQKNICLQKILRIPDHPLNRLDDRAKNRWKCMDLHPELCVQAGHLASRSSGAKEYLALQMALINQSTNWAGLERGVMLYYGVLKE